MAQPSSNRLVTESALTDQTTFQGSMLAKSYAPNQAPLYNLTPTNFNKWRTALAKVRTAAAPAKLLMLGDSTTMGVGIATNSHATCYPSQLRDLLNAYHVPAVDGLGIPQQATHNDGRYAAAGAWTYGATSTFGWGGLAFYKFPSGGAAGTLTYTPGAGAGSVDSFDVYYYTNPGLGSTTLQIDAGATQALNTAGTTSSVAKATITGAAATNHVLTIASPTGGDTYIIGIEPYLSTAKNVRVANAGVGGSTTSGWGTGSDATFGSIPTIKAYAPDLTIIMLGINDGGNGVTSATWKSNIQPTIDACKVSGDVILMSTIPSQTAATATAEQGYASTAKTMTAYGFVDLNTRQVSYAANSANGWTYDGAHLNSLGYSDVASAAFQAIRSI